MPSGVGVVLVVLLAFLFVGCAGEDEETPPPVTPVETPGGSAGSDVSEGTVFTEGRAEATELAPFTLNLSQPVPPDFRAAYQRRTLISVMFYATGQDPFYPQGLEVDGLVSDYMEELRAEYPTVEFFFYDITKPGTAQNSQDLEPGQYGTLAAQLGVGFTPWVAMMAPSGDGYVITNQFQGYVPQPVLSQSLFDLTAIEVEDNTSDADVSLEQIELTETGGGIEYFTVRNMSSDPVNLQGFALRLMNQETGEVTPDSPGVMVNEQIQVAPDQTVSVGRVPDVVDADGNRVSGTFEGGQALDLAPGDQVALLDSGGAVAATLTV